MRSRAKWSDDSRAWCDAPASTELTETRPRLRTHLVQRRFELIGAGLQIGRFLPVVERALVVAGALRGIAPLAAVVSLRAQRDDLMARRVLSPSHRIKARTRSASAERNRYDQKEHPAEHEVQSYILSEQR